MLARPTFFPLFPRISEEVFEIVKMVENVSQANFFHHFREKTKLPQKFVGKVEKVGLATFSTTHAVLEAQIVENVGQANFFHHFRDSKDFLKN